MTPSDLGLGPDATRTYNDLLDAGAPLRAFDIGEQAHHLRLTRDRLTVLVYAHFGREHGMDVYTSYGDSDPPSVWATGATAKAVSLYLNRAATSPTNCTTA